MGLLVYLNVVIGFYFNYVKWGKLKIFLIYFRRLRRNWFFVVVLVSFEFWLDNIWKFFIFNGFSIIFWKGLLDEYILLVLFFLIMVELRFLVKFDFVLLLFISVIIKFGIREWFGL